MEEDLSCAPRGWVVARLGDVIPRPRPKIQPDPKSCLLFVGMDHIEADSFHLIGHDQFAKMKSAGSYFASGDVLYGRLRPYLNKIHRAKFEGVASAEFIVLPSSEFFDGEFVKYLLHQRSFVNFAMKNSSGDRPRVKFDAIASFKFLLPPLNEQRRIVEKIETLFARLDKGEEALRRLQILLKRYRQSVLKAAVTGALTADWRAENAVKIEHGRDLLARILQTRREKWEGRGSYKEPAAPDVSGLSELPEGWVWASTEQLALVETGATPKKGNAAFYAESGTPWITSTAVNEDIISTPQAFITELALQKTNAKVFPKGSLIIALYGEGKTRGKISELGIDAATNQACAAFLVQHLPNVSKLYIRQFYEYNYLAIRTLSSGGVQPNLNLGLVKSTLIPLPPEQEQDEILDRLDVCLRRVQVTLDFCKTELVRSSALRQSILKEAFAGRLVEQDPNDEPASELLARIKGAQPIVKKTKSTKRKTKA